MKQLLQVAEEVLCEYGGQEDGISRLVKLFKSDPDLLKEALHFAADHALRVAHCNLRGRIFRAAENGDGDTHAASGRNGSANGHERKPKTYSPDQQRKIGERIDGLLAMRMSDRMTALADATKELVLHDANFHRGLAAGNAKKARFLHAVAAKLNDNQKVSDVWTEKKLCTLFSKSERAALAETA